MRHTILFLTSVLISNVFYAQAPDIEWQKTLGGSSTDWALSMKLTSDSGYIVAGYSKSNDGDVSGNHGNNDIGDFWVVKLDTAGSIEWEKSLGGTLDDWAQSIQQTSDGGYVVAGTTYSNNGDVTGNHGLQDYWVVKLSSNGSIEWQKTLGGSSDDVASGIQQTFDGGYIVAGSTYSNDVDVTGNHGLQDYWVVKLGSTGDIEWQKTLGGTDYEVSQSIQQTADSGYIVVGISTSLNGDVTGNHGNGDMWVVKLGNEGGIQWQKTFGGQGAEGAYSIQQTSDGGYIVAGYSGMKDGDVTQWFGIWDYWVVKINNNGTIEWQKSFGGTNNEEVYSIRQTSDDGYIVAGISSSNNGNVTGNHGNDDSWVIKLSSTGNLQWQKSLGGTDYDDTKSILQTLDGGYILAGGTRSTDGDVSGSHGWADYWLVKLAPDGFTGVEHLSQGEYLKMAPNPVKDKLYINYKLNGINNKLSLTVFNIQGQMVLHNRVLLSGESLNVSALPAGIYWLQAEGTESKKVYVQKIVITGVHF